jgi:hypothetical protein
MRRPKIHNLRGNSLVAVFGFQVRMTLRATRICNLSGLMFDVTRKTRRSESLLFLVLRTIVTSQAGWFFHFLAPQRIAGVTRSAIRFEDVVRLGQRTGAEDRSRTAKDPNESDQGERKRENSAPFRNCVKTLKVLAIDSLRKLLAGPEASHG